MSKGQAPSHLVKILLVTNIFGYVDMLKSSETSFRGSFIHWQDGNFSELPGF